MSGVNNNNPIYPSGYKLSRCDACQSVAIWSDGVLVYPILNAIAEPNHDMPEAVMDDFNEAVRIFSGSPRASCALLRLALQRLCIELGLPGENLNADIGKLVDRGLPEQIRQALDVVRVIGNNQVHPGHLDVRDNLAMAKSLFDLLNIVTEYMISNPKRIQDLHNLLPDGVKDQIQRRDSAAAARSDTV